MQVAYVHISTENFFLPIPVSDWLIFVADFDTSQKRNENDEHKIFDKEKTINRIKSA